MNSLSLLLLVIFAILVLARIAGSPGTKGKRGESKVNAAIRRHLDQKSYHLIENVTLPIGRGTTQIDQLVVSRFGIFVIESKNMSGWIFGRAYQPRWTQVIYGFRQSFQNPLDQNELHSRAIRNLLRLNSSYVHNVVVFVGSGVFKTPMPPEVLQGVSNLIGFIQSKTVPVFSPSAVSHFIEVIEKERLNPGTQTDRTHVQNVKRRLSKNASDSGTACPKCRGAMVERLNRNTGERFLGCTRFPQCRSSRPLR